MFCFKKTHKNSFESLRKFILFVIKKNIFKCLKINTYIKNFIILNNNTCKFNLKQYFKIIYKKSKLKKIILFAGFKIENIKNVQFWKKKPNVLLFFKDKNIEVLNECKKYNIPTLQFIWF